MVRAVAGLVMSCSARLPGSSHFPCTKNFRFSTVVSVAIINFLVSFPLEYGFALFAECSHAFAEIGGVEAGFLSDGFAVECFGQGVAFTERKSAFDTGECQGGHAGKAAAPIVDGRVQIGDGHDLVHDAEGRSLLSIDDGARGHPLESFRIPDHTRQKVGAAAIGNQADLAEHLAEFGFCAGDANVCRQRVVASYADRMAVNARDHRLRHFAQGEDRGIHDAAEIFGDIAFARVDGGEISPGAEGVAGSGEDHHAALVMNGLADYFEKALGGIAVDGIAAMGRIERDALDAIVEADQQSGLFGHWPSLAKDGLGNHGMHALVAIHKLGDGEICGNTGEHVGVVAGQMLLVDEEVDHLEGGQASGLTEVLVHAHSDVVGGGFAAGPAQMQVFAHDELKRADEGSFECGDVNLAIALAGVAVANFKERAGRIDGNEKRGSGDELFVVEIAGVEPGRSAADASGGFGRSNTHAAEEGADGNLDVLGKMRDHLLAIERNDLHTRVGKLVGQKAGTGAKTVIGERNSQFDGLDANFERDTDLRVFDVNRTGEDVSAGSFVLYLFEDGAHGGLDLIGWKPGGFETLGAAGDHGFDFDGISGTDAQSGRRVGRIIAPDDGFGCGLEAVGSAGLRGGGDSQGSEQEHAHSRHSTWRGTPVDRPADREYSV